MRILSVLACTLAALFAGFDIAGAKKGPVIRLSEREIDLGRADQFQQINRQITIGNSGDAVLKIEKVVPDCGCMAANPTDSLIAPGREMQLEIAFSTRNFEGVQRKKITIHSNDPAEPRALIHLICDVRPLVRLSEERIRFPAVRKGKTASEKIRIAADKGSGLEVTEIEGGKKLLLISIEPNPSKEEDAYWIHLKVRPDAPAGSFREALRIHTKGPPSQPREVLVTGTIISYFEVEGEPRLRLPVVSAGERSEGAIAISCDGSKPYKLLGVESAFPHLRGEIAPGGKNAYRVTVILSEETPIGTFRETVLVRTTDPAQPAIEIEVLGQVRR